MHSGFLGVGWLVPVAPWKSVGSAERTGGEEEGG